MCVTKNARHSRARARHQRASRASSPISVPPGHARVAAAAALARRSIARTRCGVGDGGGDSGRLHRASRASRALRVTRADAHVITMRRARHCRFLPPPCTTGTRALRWRRRLLDRAHTVRRWHWRWRWRSVTPHLTSAMRVIHTHAHARTCHRRFPSPPRTTGTRALRWRRRSLDREHAVTAAAAAAAAAATDDTRDDGRGDDPPPRPPQARALVSAAPPAEAPPRRPLVFSFLSSLSSSLTTRARASQRHPHHPPFRPDDGALCAHGSHPPPPPARARASETETAQRRHSDTTTRRRQLGVAGRSRSAAPHRTAEPEPEPE